MMKTTKRVLSGTLRMARGTATMLGFAVMLAVVLGVGTTALAAVPGDPFKLGKANTIDKMSTLVGSASTALLRVNNNGSGTALDLRVEPGEAPMNVNSATRINGLNADLVDGQSADEFISEEMIYTDTAEVFGTGDGAEPTLFAECDPGDKLLGGGGGSISDEDDLVESDPFNPELWRVQVRDNGSSSLIKADAICADFPPLRP